MARLLVFALLAMTSIARAQSVHAADQAFDRGLKLMETKQYAEACAAFELSQSLDPQYGTQFNLAGCYVELKKLASAWELYRVLGRSDTNAKRRAAAAAAEKSLAPRLPKLHVAVPQKIDGLHVQVGTRDVTSTLGNDIPFDLGTYELVATAPGMVRLTRQVELKDEGNVETVELTMQSEVIAKPVEKPSRRVLYGKIAIGSGAGLFVVGLVAGQRALSNRDRSTDLCNDMACPDRAGSQDAVDRARVWAAVSTATVITGLALVGGGVYLWRTSHTTTPTVAVTPSSLSIAFETRF